VDFPRCGYVMGAFAASRTMKNRPSGLEAALPSRTAPGLASSAAHSQILAFVLIRRAQRLFSAQLFESFSASPHCGTMICGATRTVACHWMAAACQAWQWPAVWPPDEYGCTSPSSSRRGVRQRHDRGVPDPLYGTITSCRYPDHQRTV
jgi:hypothetical protein